MSSFNWNAKEKFRGWKVVPTCTRWKPKGGEHRRRKSCFTFPSNYNVEAGSGKKRKKKFRAQCERENSSWFSFSFFLRRVVVVVVLLLTGMQWPNFTLCRSLKLYLSISSPPFSPALFYYNSSTWDMFKKWIYTLISDRFDSLMVAVRLWSVEKRTLDQRVWVCTFSSHFTDRPHVGHRTCSWKSELPTSILALRPSSEKSFLAALKWREFYIFQVKFKFTSTWDKHRQSTLIKV